MPGACRLRQLWRFNLILTYCGVLGRTFGTHFLYLLPDPAQLRKSVMNGHATLWLSEACSGTRLGASVAVVLREL